MSLVKTAYLTYLMLSIEHFLLILHTWPCSLATANRWMIRYHRFAVFKECRSDNVVTHHLNILLVCRNDIQIFYRHILLTMFSCMVDLIGACACSRYSGSLWLLNLLSSIINSIIIILLTHTYAGTYCDYERCGAVSLTYSFLIILTLSFLMIICVV